MSAFRLVFFVTGLLLSLAMIPGCGGHFPMSNDFHEPMRLEVTELPNLNNWLDISSQLEEIPVDEVLARLKAVENPQTVNERFYYGLLNQRLGRLDGWVQARDSFRGLANDVTLDSSSRELARILQVHNQALINWYERHRHLQKELAVSVLDRELMEEKHKELEQKIEALTTLEAVISNRKQQVVDDNNLKVQE
jgi:hypothetical protein